MTLPVHESVFALVDAGMGMREAARRLGISPNVASGALSRRRGYKRRDPGAYIPRERPAAAFTTQVGFRVDDDTLAQIDARRKNGASRAQVVRELVEWALEEFS